MNNLRDNLANIYLLVVRFLIKYLNQEMNNKLEVNKSAVTKYNY